MHICTDMDLNRIYTKLYLELNITKIKKNFKSIASMQNYTKLQSILLKFLQNSSSKYDFKKRMLYLHMLTTDLLLSETHASIFNLTFVIFSINIISLFLFVPKYIFLMFRKIMKSIFGDRISKTVCDLLQNYSFKF